MQIVANWFRKRSQFYLSTQFVYYTPDHEMFRLSLEKVAIANGNSTHRYSAVADDLGFVCFHVRRNHKSCQDHRSPVHVMQLMISVFTTSLQLMLDKKIIQLAAFIQIKWSTDLFWWLQIVRHRHDFFFDFFFQR